ncbi:hypothetical protein BKA56DRAFT_573174 [Ilyonectria sp. MPI-CAGE-AT-0026]|nr:hypothetical protein BKA56DRAFT_573174 [Ilyonectria sp. MPI-CAGE-AT-0026]
MKQISGSHSRYTGTIHCQYGVRKVHCLQYTDRCGLSASIPEHSLPSLPSVPLPPFSCSFPRQTVAVGLAPNHARWILISMLPG